MDIRTWKVFSSVESAFAAGIRMAMVVGTGKVGLMVTRNDDVFSIGHGQLLGIKGSKSTPIPQSIPQLSGKKIKGIYCGDEFVITMTERGELYTWGSNAGGELGVGNHISSSDVPILVTLPNKEQGREVACGAHHVIVLTTSGKVYAWGSNRNGQVCCAEADQGAVVVWKPKEILREAGGLLQGGQLPSLACSRQSSFALAASGEVWAWGQNVLEGLGNRIHPTLIPLETTVIKIVCSSWGVLVLDNKGYMTAWGSGGLCCKLTKPTRILCETFPFIDIESAWHANFYVCRSKYHGIYVWGSWMGQDFWKRPVSTSLRSMEMAFAADLGLMCRPVCMPLHSGGLALALSQHFNNPELADVEFKLKDGRSVYAHRLILVSRSTYFATMLNSAWTEGLTRSLYKISLVKCNNVDPDAFTCFLRYLYTDSLPVHMLQSVNSTSAGVGAICLHKVLDLFITADYYCQLDLLNECQNLLLSVVSVENASEVYHVASALNAKDLESRACLFMAS